MTGKELRKQTPRKALGAYDAPTRRDPVGLLRRLSRGWLPELVDLRYERMLASPLAFLRGAAAIMAADLRAAPRTGVRVQALGDAHLLNFGGHATPERRLVFDVEDFDETRPGAWEDDIKRLAASVAVADGPAEAAAAGYREAIAEYAQLTALEVFAAEVEAGDIPLLRNAAATWSHHTSRWELPRLTGKDGTIAADAPVTEAPPPAVAAALRSLPKRYARTLAPDARALLARYEVVDVARHAVGVGSFGTRCFVILLRGADHGDPLFLQVKEARPSGRRVVAGQRLAQAGADALLGWTTVGRTPVYVRQLRDMRGAVDLTELRDLGAYARLCGRALARAHARTGPAATIAAYLGKGSEFDDAIARFAAAYATQTERDHAALAAALGSRS